MALVDVVTEEVRRVGGGKVSDVAVEIGGLQSIEPQSLELCFETIVEGTDLEGARLVVTRRPIRVRCDTCRGDTVADRFFRCTTCGGRETAVIASGGLTVASIRLSP